MVVWGSRYECFYASFVEVFFAGAWDVECSNLSEEVVSDGHTVVAPGFVLHGIFGLEVLKTFG